MPPRPAERPTTPPGGDDWPLPAIAVPPGTRLFRLNLRRFDDPAYFGRRGVYRFDPPDRSFGVCYLGTTLDCCLLEVLLPARRPKSRERSLSRGQLREYDAAIATVVDPPLSATTAPSLAGRWLSAPSRGDHWIAQRAGARRAIAE